MTAVFSIGTAIERFLYKLVALKEISEYSGKKIPKYISEGDRKKIVEILKNRKIEISVCHRDVEDLIRGYDDVIIKVDNRGIDYLHHYRNYFDLRGAHYAAVCLIEYYTDNSYLSHEDRYKKIQSLLTYIVTLCVKKNHQ